MRLLTESLAEAQRPEDDWSGLKNAKARRKIQNRLNVRAHRNRKALQTILRESSEASVADVGFSVRVISGPIRYRDKDRPPRLPPIGLPSACHQFPLSLDHIIPLVQYNVMRALQTNMSLLCLCLSGDCESENWVNVPAFSHPAAGGVPEELVPTPLQLSTPHDTWLDLGPDARFRDNVIRAITEGEVDLDELSADVTGCGGEGMPLNMTGLLVWTTPWSIWGWEVTEGFARKYGGRLLKGCDEVMRATNYWREQRGEEPLTFEVVEGREELCLSNFG